MNTVRDEIEIRFANVSPGHASPLGLLPDTASAWVIRRANGEFGVGVPYDGDAVSERFAGAHMYSVKEGELGEDFPGMLLLLSKDEDRRNEFSLLCSDFVDPGTDGWKRTGLIQRPLAWWEGWRELLGNAMRDMQPHSVLGELLIYEYLLERENGQVAWTGPSGASHDFQGESGDAEVKSTLQRYDSLVQITGQFQLQDGADLWLYLCRLEPSGNGVSIDDIVKRVSRHVRGDDLNARLAGLGYEPGNSARRERFTVLEVRRYHVDDSFPRISAQSFVGGAVPPGIQRISYAVDLGMVPSELIQLPREYYGAVSAESSSGGSAQPAGTGRRAPEDNLHAAH